MISAPRRIISYAVLWLWSAVSLFPVYWLAVTSVKPATGAETEPRYLPFVDFTPDLSAWRFVLFDQAENMMRGLGNSLAISTASAALTLAAACLAVYGLSRFPFTQRLDRLIMNGVLATRILPPVVLALPLYMMAQRVDLLDTRLALILTYSALNLPVAMWLLAPIFGSRATEQEEAARLDGASHLLILRSVLLPMLTGGIAAAGLFMFVLCWNEYLLAAVLAADRAATVPVWLMGQLSMKEAQATAEAEELARFAAAATLMLVPLMAVTGLVHKAIARGALRQS
jgi:multiple sugar transport system permease protein